MQRRFPRIASRHVVLLTPASESDADAFARTRELSMGGCCFIIDDPPQVEAVVRLSIALADRVVQTVSRIVWVRETEGRHEVGAEFLKIDPVDRAAIEAMTAPG